MEVFIIEEDADSLNVTLGISNERGKEMKVAFDQLIKHHYGGVPPVNPGERIYMASMLAKNTNELTFYCFKAGMSAVSENTVVIEDINT